jgi:hypothetical protein
MATLGHKHLHKSVNRAIKIKVATGTIPTTKMTKKMICGPLDPKPLYKKQLLSTNKHPNLALQRPQHPTFRPTIANPRKPQAILSPMPGVNTPLLPLARVERKSNVAKHITPSRGYLTPMQIEGAFKLQKVLQNPSNDHEIID